MKKYRLHRLIFLLVTGYWLLVTLSYASPTQPAETALAAARGCHLYDLGKLDEAMCEFQFVLLNDPKNKTAQAYVDKIWERLDDTQTTSWQLNEEMLGYRNALSANRKIELQQQDAYPVWEDQREPYERFINNTTFGYNDRRFQASSDRSFSPDGFFIAEHMRMDSAFEDGWKNTFSLDARYHDNSHEDARFRRITYTVSNPGGLRFIAGDTSTRLSRYVMRGIYYRGANLSMNSGKNEFKVLAGAIPQFLVKTSDNQNRDNDTYIYPRRVFGVRDAYRFFDRYKAGISYMELNDTERLRVLDQNYNPKVNRVVAIDQAIDLAPGVWKIETENAYSTSDEDKSDKDIFMKEKELKDFAHYIRSAIQTPKFRLINSYERIGADFRSHADVASTTTTWLAGLTTDREKIDNYLEYRPFDPIYWDIRFSRVRNNLDKDNDVEMNQMTNYETGLRFMPQDDYEWLPQSAVRINLSNTLSVPGSQYASNDATDRDIIFELAKKLYGVDLNTSYTRRKTIDNTETFGTYSNIYGLRAAKELTDMVLLSTAYSHSNSYKNENGGDFTVGRENFFNISTALRLWAGANLSFGYSYESDTDMTGVLGNTKTNSYSSTFSWPISKYFLSNGTELSLSPYLTWQYVDDWGSEANAGRLVWTAACDAAYHLEKDQRISASALYRRDDQDDSSLTTPAGAKDYRFLLTYQKIFQ